MIEIEYAIHDPFDSDGEGRPVVGVTGTISVLEGDTAAVIGEIGFSRIDIDTADDYGGVTTVLDEESAEWINSYGAFAAGMNELGSEADEIGEFCSGLIILDRLRLDPEWRRRGIGPHVIARAIRTFAHGQDLVVLTAAPTEGPKPGTPEHLAGAERLAEHWGKLGFERVTTDCEVPVLAAWFGNGEFDDTLRSYSVLALADHSR